MTDQFAGVMNEVFRQLGTPTRGGIVCIVDHASNHIPDDIDLGIPAHLFGEHMAFDIGTEAIAEILARDHEIPAHIAAVSRLVCDLNREEEAAGLVPETSDGHRIPGNAGADREARLTRFHRPYHTALAQWLAVAEPALILSLHSFTPQLATSDERRPWEVGVLYNSDDRAANIAMPLLAEAGLHVGDNLPYSGRHLNYTMNRHAEAFGRPYLGIEIRQDLAATPLDHVRWARLLAGVAQRVALEAM
ncbi:N-formylglutamate amidohydrolase [Allopontixanthobacter sp.]|uniref:N-formylglutamate amidohydrolase n=1 Tax=Allopontixanthobacter sp. TaxID=2906452 RepID=UPI002ABC6A39|nr:N-formylglutamate amidohydrolase [Allopontixanthobacter sp.]MDZ4308074.1 N-formylglutamate amidohydrolase [Allopontixanthobacter sp.]